MTETKKNKTAGEILLEIGRPDGFVSTKWQKI